MKSQTFKGWTGGVSTDWNVAGNWDPVGVPTSSTGVTIPGTGISNWPVLANDVNLQSLQVNPGGQIDTKGFLLDINYSGLFLDGAIIKNSNAGTDIRIKVYLQGTIINSTFEKQASIEYNGPANRFRANYLYEESNHFLHDVKFVESGEAAILLSNVKSIYDGDVTLEKLYEGQNPNLYSSLFVGGATIKGNFKYTNIAGGICEIGPGIAEIAGNAEIVHSGRLFLPEKINIGGTSTVRLVGSGLSTITQSGTDPFIFSNLSIEKTGDGYFAVYSGFKIAGNLSFISGNAISSEGPLIFVDGATTSGASDGSHIVGTADKIGNDAFTFPIGTGTKLTSVSISAPLQVTDRFSAAYLSSYPFGNPYNSASKVASLARVFDEGRWEIKRIAGLSNVNVSLGYNFPSGYVTDQSKLRVAHWNGSLWEDLGNGGTSGSLTVGTVSTASGVTSFSPFTIASSDASNPLPVKLIKFSVQKENETALLQWSTTEEVNSDHFDIEHSQSASDWQKIGEVDALGNSTSLFEYSFVHPKPLKGQNYYRLKMVDVDGTFAYSKVESLKFSSGTETVTYPNPVSNRLFIETSNGASALSVVLTNSAGINILAVKAEGLPHGIDLSNLSAGIYFVKITLSNGQKETHKVFVSR